MTPAAMEALSSSVRRLRTVLEADLAVRLGRDTTLSEVAARTLFRLIFVRQLEACGVYRPARAGGEQDGFGRIERLFAELAIDLPGLYGDRDVDARFAPSAAALREVKAALDADDLQSAWDDDTALGWAYQFWNDPHREAIDVRIGPRGKVLPHEIATKTQLFTESYMVDWLLQNSVGRIALPMRERRGGSLAAGAMSDPSWPMFVRGAAGVDPGGLPKRLSELTVLDPACGSGHFLAGAFDLLVPLYRQEARDAETEVSDADIAAAILEHNLHGIDIDGGAVRVAAAVLYLKARRLAPGGRIPPMNLVATEDFRGSLTRVGRPAPCRVASPDVGDGKVLDRGHYGRSDDLGVRFDGPQVTAGARLRRLLVEGRYDVVAFNPPYLATSKIDVSREVLAEAFGDAPDIFAAFVDRAFELCKPTGLVAFVALSNWMFLSTFQGVRRRMLQGSILLLADVGKGAFRRASKLIQTAMVVASPRHDPEGVSLAARIGSRDAISASQPLEIARALADPSVYRPFEPHVLSGIEGTPLLLGLDPDLVRRYERLPKIGDVADSAGGIATTDNERFLRAVWEVAAADAAAAIAGKGENHTPYIKGAEGREWIEPCRWLLRTRQEALEIRVLLPGVRVDRPAALGVAYTTIGQRFAARLHTVASVRDVSGASVFPGPRASAEALVCALNRRVVRELASAFNPTINFQIGDVRRLPFDAVEGSDEIVRVLRGELDRAERGDERSLRYERPTANRWADARAWAQEAVDRPRGAPLPPERFSEGSVEPWLHLSHAVGVALGRFRAEGGIAEAAPGGSLADGILYLGGDETSSLRDSACDGIRAAWARVGPELGGDLASYLKNDFFGQHKRLYEGRPIYLPLSSTKRAFVAYVLVHRWRPDTLSVLLAGRLVPERRRLEEQLVELREAHRRAPADRRPVESQKVLDELDDFIAKVTEIAERGPPRPDDRTTRREVDARHAFDLDDGVLVNSAALWPLLDPQWKDPKRWWKDLADARGKKDYDWSRVAARYFPARVRGQCRSDPSLAVAHGCFRELHPAKARAWEARLKEEHGRLGIEEPGS